MQKPIDVPCTTCEALPGEHCAPLRGQAPLGFARYHSPRRRDAGDDSGPISVDYNHIKRGTFMHGCGETYKVDHVATMWNGYEPYGYNERNTNCKRCLRPLWISDLGPVVDLSKTDYVPTDGYVETQLF